MSGINKTQQKKIQLGFIILVSFHTSTSRRMKLSLLNYAKELAKLGEWGRVVGVLNSHRIPFTYCKDLLIRAIESSDTEVFVEAKDVEAVVALCRQTAAQRRTSLRTSATVGCTSLALGTAVVATLPDVEMWVQAVTGIQPGNAVAVGGFLVPYFTSLGAWVWASGDMEAIRRLDRSALILEQQLEE